MTTTVLIVLVVLVLAVGLFVFRAIPGLRAYFQFRGKRLVTCPETKEAAAVEVAATEAAAKPAGIPGGPGAAAPAGGAAPAAGAPKA